jgi:hypothetical protein
MHEVFTMHSKTILVGVLAAAVMTSAATGWAAPLIRNVSLRGLQAGAPTLLVIDGEDLSPNPQLVLPVNIAAQTVKSAQPNRLELEVTLAADAAPGLYNLRVASASGISNAVVVGVDSLPQLPIAEAVPALPAALTGSLTGSGLVKVAFDGRTGQDVTVEVESQRLGAKLRPVLHLYDASGRQRAWSMPNRKLAGDARLQAKLPADGRYTIELHDSQYAGQGPGHFRLKIGSFPFADLAFPPVVQRGAKAEVALIGGVPAEAKAVVEMPTDTDIVPASWPGGIAASGPRAAVRASDVPEIVEAPRTPESPPQELPAAPCAVSGKLAAKGERDVYRLKAAAGTRLGVELFSDRYGTLLDGVLEVINDKGGALARADDQQTTADPRQEVTMPADSQWLDFAISDLHARGGEDMLYRLVITPLDAPPAEDFRLIVAPESPNLGPQGTYVLQVLADRKGYSGPIKLAFDKLPGGVRVEGSEIAAGADGALLTLVGEASQAASVIALLRGEATTARGAIQRRAQLAAGEESKSLSPWLLEEIAVATTVAPQFAAKVDWNALADDTKLYHGDNLALPVRLTRSFGDGGPVRISILTSQKTPVNNQGQREDNRALRINQATEVAVDPKVKAAFDALAAAAKALADAQQKLDAAAAANQPTEELKKVVDAATPVRDAAAKALADAEAVPQDATATLVIPQDLVERPYDFTVRAELLSGNKQRVLSSAFTKVRAIPTAASLVVALDGAAERPVTLDKQNGATVELVGKIQRLTGAEGDVAITVEGLPQGVGAPTANVKADAVDYKLELKLPANLAPNSYKGIKVVARGKRKTNANAMVDIRAETPALQLNVAAAP